MLGVSDENILLNTSEGGSNFTVVRKVMVICEFLLR